MMNQTMTLSLTKRKIDPKTAYKEQIAAQPGGDTLLVQRQRFAIAQPQNFLCYPGHYVRMGLGADSLNKRKKPPAFRKGKRWFCQSGYQVALLARLLITIPSGTTSYFEYEKSRIQRSCFYSTIEIGLCDHKQQS